MEEIHEEEKHHEPNYHRLFEGIRGFKSNEHIPKQEFLLNWENTKTHIHYSLAAPIHV